MLPERNRGHLLQADATRAAFLPVERPPVYAQEDLDDAYTRGFLGGAEDAQAELRRACNQIAERVTAARDVVIDELRRIDAARRDEIVDFAFEVATWLVQSEIAADPKRILARLEAALPDRLDEVTVRIAPALVAVVKGAVPTATVVGDAALSLGDVVITGPDAQLNGTLTDALERLRIFLDADDGGAVR